MSLLPFPSRPFDKPLPPVPVEGSGDFCLTFDKKWLPYVLGALGVFCAGGTWESDKERCISEGMTLLAQVMQGEDCPPAPGPDLMSLEGDDCMGCCLRWNNGVLEMLSCGEWQPVPTNGSGGFEPTQPGAGAPQPQPGGGTAEYCGALSGNNKYHLPTNVSSGDTIVFSRLNGSWNDGVEISWHCPDGWLYVLGSCFEEPLYNGGTDPLIGTMHMSIVASINGDFYDVLNIDGDGNPQPFTVPAGYDNADVVVQANVDYGGQIYGEVTFCIDVTNNQAGTFTHVFDLRATDGGFEMRPIGTGGVGAQGHWEPGVGWHADAVAYAPAAGYNLIDVKRDFSPQRKLTSVQVYYEKSNGTSTKTDNTDDIVTSLAGTLDFKCVENWLSVPASPWVCGFAPTLADSFGFGIFCGAEPGGGDPGGTITVYKVVVTGEGSDPF